MIGIFKTSCPAGWTRVTAYDDKIIRAMSSAGGTGGSLTHTHTITFPATTLTNASSISVLSGAATPNKFGINKSPHAHTVASTGSLTTTAGSSLPAYIAVVFCSTDE